VKSLGRNVFEMRLKNPHADIEGPGPRAGRGHALTFAVLAAIAARIRLVHDQLIGEPKTPKRARGV
jgi:hypothetical protein